MIKRILEDRNRLDQLLTEEIDELLEEVNYLQEEPAEKKQDDEDEDEDEDQSNMAPVKGDEDDDEEDDDEDDDLEKGTRALYKRVQGLLNNDLFNHAAIVERLWGEKDATNRSLFRKKLNKEVADDGTVYKFERDELSDILSILSTAASEVRTATGKTKRQEKTGGSKKQSD